MKFTPARPIGCRASGKTPNTFELHDKLRPEMKALYEGNFDPAIPPASLTVIRQRIRELVSLVRDGQLRFDEADPEAKVMGRHDCVYYIKPRLSGRIPKRVIRLYCGEPKLAPQVVLGLHLASKPGTAPDTEGEQDKAIDTAVKRGGNWELEYLRSQGRVR